FEFEDLHLDRAAPDVLIWETCQREGVILITANRNQDDATSLEETIRTHNRPDSLPVFTLAQPKRIRRNRTYANRVVESLLEHLLDIDQYLGGGRLFLP